MKYSLFFVGILLATGATGRLALATPSETTWVQGGAYRLIARVYKGQPLSENPILVIVLHGDAPRENPGYQYAFAARAAANRDVVAIGLLRPGYTDSEGNTSEGLRGQSNGDNYNSQNTDAVSKAIGELKRRYRGRKLLVAAHSGGAALTANILGRYPELIDAALLVSCPCDVVAWRKNMYQFTKESLYLGRIDTLSPIELIYSMSNKVNVTLVAGTQDKITPLSLSKKYQERASKAGKRVRLVQLKGRGHDLFLEPAVFAEFSRMLNVLQR